MEISAKGDYAIRALTALTKEGRPMTVVEVAAAQDIPVRFLQGILLRLRQRGLLISHRGSDGGYQLARAPDSITVADVLRAVEGPLAAVRGIPPEEVVYSGVAQPLSEVWLALRASMRRVIERVTLLDIVEGPLPEYVQGLLANPDAWRSG